MFHGVFRSLHDAHSGATLPCQCATVCQLSQFIGYFRASGYGFVAPDDICRGLDPHGYHVLLTFDDGYFNNCNVLPLLQEHNIPAVFFIPTSHIRTGKAFWWDVVYRRRADLCDSARELARIYSHLSSLRTSDIESWLGARLGSDALAPVGGLDRPMTAAELAELAKDSHVHLGNHTDDHAALTNYSETEVAQQINKCQTELERITGRKPIALSYPHGLYSETIIQIARRAGLQLGFICRPGKTMSSRTSRERMALKRNVLLENRDQLSQYLQFRADLGLHRVLSGIRWQTRRLSHLRSGTI
jgi:peptidoglycan/xylan/chitin deacetylase (PgdA/CDA1 family)